MYFNSFETLDYRLQDALYQKQERGNPDIVIIGIDDESLDFLGRWPWPRDYHGELVRILSEGEPAAIGFDIIMSEPSNDEYEDHYLLEMVEEAGNLLFPLYGNFGSTARRGSLEAVSVTRPFDPLDQLSSLGHINTLMDNDGIVRKAILTFNYEGEKINSFSWELYRIYQESLGKEPMKMEDIPMDPWQRTSIRYSGEPKSIEMIPYYLVVTGEIPGEYFRDKIVLVGPTAIGLADDYYFTPMAPQVPMYGVEIHGNIIQQLIEGRFWAEVSILVQIGILMILGLLGYYLFGKFRPGLSLIILLAMSLGFVAILKYMSLGDRGYILSFVYPIGFLGTQYIAVLGEKFILEQLEKKRVTDVFGKYVAPQIVNKILDEGEEGLHLGGTRRDITVLFVDIRGFTPLSESAEPEEVVSILNDYLTLCAQSIFKYGGTLDKYIGDAAMAIYNAPLDLDNHQLRAVQTAWAMKEGAGPLQERLEKRFGRLVRFGVGIHTGPAIVGNIGADFRMDFTAIGDTVNTAARIESNSQGGQILISDQVYEQVKEHLEVTDIGLIKVKGKAQGLQVYQVDKLLTI